MICMMLKQGKLMCMSRYDPDINIHLHDLDQLQMCEVIFVLKHMLRGLHSQVFKPSLKRAAMK